MARGILKVFILWIVGVGFIVAHYLFCDRDFNSGQFSSLVTLTGFSSPSFSNAFYEPRLLEEEALHPSYPQMHPINKMDFVYAR